MKLHGQSCVRRDIVRSILVSRSRTEETLLIGILKETSPGETRVALLPESLKSLRAQAIDITVESGAGVAAGASDQAYIEAAATITPPRSLLTTAVPLPPGH